MKWSTPNFLLRGIKGHPDFPRAYNLEKRTHRYSLLHNTKGLQTLIKIDHKAAWSLIDALVSDVLERAGDVSEHQPDRLRLGLYIRAEDIRSMDVETVGMEALWALPMLMEASIFSARPVLARVNKQLDIWFRYYRQGRFKDIEYGPLLAVAWMQEGQRQQLMQLIAENDGKNGEVRDPQRIMGAQYLLGCEPSSWDGHDYLAASHGIQHWFKRLFFQVAPHQCYWITKPNPLIGEWFADYWQAAQNKPGQDDVRRHLTLGLEAMTFPLDQWYSWWSWHSLVASPTCRNEQQWLFTGPSTAGANGTFRSGRQPLSRPNGIRPIDADIVASMQNKHPDMAAAYRHWSQLASCTLESSAGDVKKVERMWDMYNASLRAPQEMLSLDGLLNG